MSPAAKKTAAKKAAAKPSTSKKAGAGAHGATTSTAKRARPKDVGAKAGGATKASGKTASAKRAPAPKPAARTAGAPTPAPARRPGDGPRYWLMKSEPDVFSFDDLLAAPDRTTCWEGVRNYQARNFMRDGMRVGDRVLYYHSNAEPPGVAGIAEVAREAYPDHTQFDPTSDYFDAKSDPAAPQWLMVDVRAVEKLPRFVSLDLLRAEPSLAEMLVLRRASRLSVTPVTAEEFATVCRLGGARAAR